MWDWEVPEGEERGRDWKKGRSEKWTREEPERMEEPEGNGLGGIGEKRAEPGIGGEGD